MITVILPCYNGANTIPDAVKSVWMQNRDDLEIVAIDDASTDETRAVLRDLSGESPVPMRIVVNETNQLTARSINRVYPSAGEFVTILHQDDVYPPGRFDRQIERLEVDPTLMVVFANGVNFDDGGVRGPLHDESTNRLLRSNPRQIEHYLRENQNPIFLQPAVIRRELLERISGFDEDCMSDDWVTNIRIFSALAGRHEFDYIDESVYNRRKHEGNFHRNQRTMSALRMQVLHKYAVTERRHEVLARHYREQAGYLSRHGFLEHAACMLALAGLRHQLSGDEAGRDDALEQLFATVGPFSRPVRNPSPPAVASDVAPGGYLAAEIERLLLEGPSARGYQRLCALLDEAGLREDAGRLRARMASIPLPSRPSGIDTLVRQSTRLPAPPPRGSSLRRRIQQRLARHVPRLRDPTDVEGALWEHYLLVEMLRYDLHRRGVIL